MQNKESQKGRCNKPTKLRFHWVLNTENFMLSKRYVSIGVDRSTWQHVQIANDVEIIRCERRPIKGYKLMLYTSFNRCMHICTCIRSKNKMLERILISFAKLFIWTLCGLNYVDRWTLSKSGSLGYRTNYLRQRKGEYLLFNMINGL